MKIPLHSMLLAFLTPQTIKNLDKPVCKDCIYFKQDLLTNQALAKCTKFGHKNVITGQVFHEFADICRNDEKQCGINGTYFKQHHGFFN